LAYSSSNRQYVYAVIRDQVEQTPMPATQLPKGISLHIRTFADLSTSELYEILKAGIPHILMEKTL